MGRDAAFKTGVQNILQNKNFGKIFGRLRLIAFTNKSELASSHGTTKTISFDSVNTFIDYRLTIQTDRQCKKFCAVAKLMELPQQILRKVAKITVLCRLSKYAVAASGKLPISVATALFSERYLTSSLNRATKLRFKVQSPIVQAEFTEANVQQLS